jgi:phosphoesterase RecJ-like protein
MTFKEIIRMLDEKQVSQVLLLCHHNSDPDAVCSAYAFQGLLKKIRPKITSEIGTGQGVSKLSKNLFKHIPINVNLKPEVEKAHAIILLDTNTIQQLDGLAQRVTNSTAPIIVIDHHAPHPETQNICALCITKEEASSTCDIIYEFYCQQKIKPDPTEALALFLGMAFDTRHFILANASTFKAVANLVDNGVKPQEALAMMGLPMELSERIARIKACKRSKIIRIDKWIIAFSHVSAYQASAARSLLDLGAHMVAVAGQKNKGLEISFRCTKEFAEKTGIHLGKDIAKPLGEAISGMGGGHAMAAGANGKGDPKTILKECLRLLKENLKTDSIS